MMRTPLMKWIGLTLIGLVLGLTAGVAMADVVVVVPAGSPVTTLSKNQIADIFLGKTNRFPDGTRAVPVDQTEGSAARDAFYLKFTGKSPAQVKVYWSKLIFTGRGQPPHEVSNGVEVKKHLSENPNSIGYIEQNRVDGGVRVLLVK